MTNELNNYILFLGFFYTLATVSCHLKPLQNYVWQLFIKKLISAENNLQNSFFKKVSPFKKHLRYIAKEIVIGSITHYKVFCFS